MKNSLIFNAAVGPGQDHYLKGQSRLMTSLTNVNYQGVTISFDTWPDPNFDQTNPYTIKAAAFHHILKLNHPRYLVWMDSSAVVLREPTPLFERIRKRGYYLASSGYSAAQTCTDIQLGVAGYTRTQAESIPDTATGCIGIDTKNSIAMKFLKTWIEWAKLGHFSGSRLHDINDSSDPRFLFGRQDQSAATLIAYSLGMTLDNLGGLTAYHPAPPSSIMEYKGIQ
jgi:hypothetical protein